MNTLTFLKEIIEDIKPKLALGSNNPHIEFLDLTVGEFETLRESIYKEYSKIIRLNHMFGCCGLVELSNVIDSLPVEKIYKGE